ILATTEVHKLPATILSRCQRFDFKRIQPETMSKRLMQVAELENIELEKNAALLISRIADGALRDGLSILDQCAGRASHIDEALVSEVAGIAGKEALFTLSSCIVNNDSSTAIRTLSELYNNSYDMERLCVELIAHFRNLLVIKTVKSNRELIVSTDDEYNALCGLADSFTVEGITCALDLLQNTYISIKSGASPRIEVETSFIKLCEPKLSADISSVLERVSRLERAVKDGVKVTADNLGYKEPEAKAAPTEIKAEEKPLIKEEKREAPPVPKPVKPSVTAPVENEASTPAPAPAAPEQPAPAQQTDSELVEFTQWGEFMEEIRNKEITLYSILVNSTAYLRNGFFLISSPNPTIGEFLNKNNYAKTIKAALYNVTGERYRVGIYNKPVAKKQNSDPLDDFIRSAQSKTDLDVK
ncbi:MAG: hypothetical protein K6C14_01805, partial [Eubacterium sp.]|nr:hypothetical protein [Eubacterium sp.]